jgi:NADPH:quinone reductase-like Zn-dependent oxidoreductase/acyl carrier protein
VLIHAAAGGTGLALVQTALNAGCEVFATANPSKWEFLRKLGVRHVMSSRTLDFAREIMDRTAGEGIDVVVNSLAGEFIRKSFSVLRANGRFLEMGKTDIWEHADVEREYPHVEYLPFNLVDLCLENPPLAARLIREVLAGFEAGRLHPLPATVFPIERTVDAFRYMAQARHIGRVVVAWDSSIKPADNDQLRIRSDAAYLITGGTGGLGIEVAQWLAQQGARHLFLVARRAPAGHGEAAIAELSRRGVNVRVVSADVSRPDDVAATVAEIDAAMVPLRGVIHAAGVLDDATVLQCDWARFRAVLNPKVAGSWNLHEATQNHQLDFFVLFSGAAGMLGLAGQANYVAANAFLDALAQYRRSLGLPALSIEWSAWSSVGLAAARANRGERLAMTGIGSISPKAGLRVFEQLLNQDRSNVAVIPWDVALWRRHYPAQAGTPFYSEINVPAGDQTAAVSLAARLADADPKRRAVLLEQFLQEQAARVLRLSPSRIEPLTPFNTLGFDSLMALEFRNRLEMELKIPLSATLVWAYPTVASLARHLAEKLQVPLEAETEQKAELVKQSSENGALDSVLDGLLTLSDDQAAALLEGRDVARNAAKG